VSAQNPKNTAASVRQRLLNRSREESQEFQLVLTRYALERLIYRLSLSPYAEKFILKETSAKGAIFSGRRGSGAFWVNDLCCQGLREGVWRKARACLRTALGSPAGL
jgi:hypothetical protein